MECMRRSGSRHWQNGFFSVQPCVYPKIVQVGFSPHNFWAKVESWVMFSRKRTGCEQLLADVRLATEGVIESDNQGSNHFEDLGGQWWTTMWRQSMIIYGGRKRDQQLILVGFLKTQYTKEKSISLNTHFSRVEFSVDCDISNWSLKCQLKQDLDSDHDLVQWCRNIKMKTLYCQDYKIYQNQQSHVPSINQNM